MTTKTLQTNLLGRRVRLDYGIDLNSQFAQQQLAKGKGCMPMVKYQNAEAEICVVHLIKEELAYVVRLEDGTLLTLTGATFQVLPETK